MVGGWRQVKNGNFNLKKVKLVGASPSVAKRPLIADAFIEFWQIRTIYLLEL